jgi:peptidoglycan/xylan/chitin deacetylase (PgdA/CDA1 family)
MGWEDLKALAEAGMTIGAHSMTHGALTREEVTESKRLLEARLGVKVEHFAYPKGEHTPESEGWVREAGYKAGWATKSGNAETFTRQRLPVSAQASLADFAARLLKARLGYYKG